MTRQHAIEVEAPWGWARLFEEGPAFCRGYITAHKAGPTPRVAVRIVRADTGAIVDSCPAVDTCGIGQIAGSPSAEDYRRAEAKMRTLAEQAEERERRAALRHRRDDGQVR